jgi:hypothetical protein
MAQQKDERAVERDAILRRRAKLAACAVMAGVGLPECSSVCLSIAEPNRGGSSAIVAGAGGSETACLSAGAPGIDSAGQGGQSFCLTIAETAGAAGEAGVSATAGAPTGGAASGGEGGGPT